MRPCSEGTPVTGPADGGQISWTHERGPVNTESAAERSAVRSRTRLPADVRILSPPRTLPPSPAATPPIPLRRRDYLETGIKHEVKPTSVKVPVGANVRAHLDSIAGQPLTELFESLITDPSLRVTRADCDAVRRMSEVIAPLSSFFREGLVRTAGSTVRPSESRGIGREVSLAFQVSDIWLGEIYRTMISRSDLTPAVVID
jgi:hypothetical protein